MLPSPGGKVWRTTKHLFFWPKTIPEKVTPPSFRMLLGYCVNTCKNNSFVITSFTDMKLNGRNKYFDVPDEIGVYHCSLCISE